MNVISRFLCLIVAMGAIAHAQSSNANANALANANVTGNGASAQGAGASSTDMNVANKVWDVIRGFGRFDSPWMGRFSTDPALARADRAKEFLAQANQLRAYYRQFPTHAHTGEARRLEALCLGWAAYHGETSQDSRRLALIEQVKADKGFSPEEKCEVVALNADVLLARQRFSSEDAYLAAKESGARGLIAEFPSAAQGYERLLAVANDAGPARGGTIAGELARMGGPSGAKNEAALLSERYQLVGKPADTVFRQAGATWPAAPTTQPTILYTWSAADSASLRAAKEFEWLNPDAQKIGINLDSDVAAAKQVAAREKLAGEHVFDASGPTGRVAAALKLNRAGQVYLVDRSGIIRDVQGQVRTAQKLAQFGKGS